MLADASIVTGAVWLAGHSDESVFGNQPDSIWFVYVLVSFLTVLQFSRLGIYRWVIRSGNSRLIEQLIKGCVLSAGTLLVVCYLFTSSRDLLTMAVIYGAVLFLGATGIRYLWVKLVDLSSQGQPVAIYGAGVAGRQLALQLGLADEFRAAAFLDDDPALWNATVAGLPVLDSSRDDLEECLKMLSVGSVILAMPSSEPSENSDRLRRVASLGMPVRTVPGIAELISGKKTLGNITDIAIEHLLMRNEALTEHPLTSGCVTGRVVMVTGGGGSIGSELCRQILKLSPKKLIVLDHSEGNIYQVDQDLREFCQNLRLDHHTFTTVLGTVADRAWVKSVLKKNKVDTVYHAAAYKHVPIIEAQPAQGVRVNIFGTLNVLDASISTGVKHFVLISTDKAVRPANAMGASKRVAELILQAKANQKPSGTRICMVRFGNVLGSSGSAVPLFRKQIESGGPVTLTHPDITRYFMTIPEAARLVIQASSIARGGDVFVLDMGQPIRIEDLAVNMVHLHGKSLARDTGNENDIHIVQLGLRPGEKMYEELFIDHTHEPTVIPGISTAHEWSLPWLHLETRLACLESFCRSADSKAIRAELMTLAFGTHEPEQMDSTMKKPPANEHMELSLDRVAEH